MLVATCLLFTVSQFRMLSTAEQVCLIVGFLLSLVFLTLILRYLYSVMCRRDYAKWRKSAGRNTLQNRLVRLCFMWFIAFLLI